MNAPNFGQPARVGVREISTMLADRIEALCRTLGLRGRVDQGMLKPLNPTRRDRNPGSFVIHINGAKQGRWDEYATGDFGDALDLVAYIQFGRVDRISQREAVIWAKRWLGIGDASHMDPAHCAKLAEAKARMERETERAERMALENRERQRRSAQGMFLAAQELAPGTAGWAYLTARGIDLGLLPRLPWAVRSHPAMKHVETGREVPCLISAMLFPDGSFGAVHRIFLEPDGRQKLQVEEGVAVKKIWPSGWHGAVIPISRGRHGLSPAKARDKGLTEECAFVEGVEDGFTVALLTPEWRVSAVGASANFAHAPLPVSASHVIAVRDRDPNPRVRKGVDRKIAELRSKADAEGLPFLESWPPRGFKDFNDVLRGVRA